MKKGRKLQTCPVETTLAAIGGRWKVLVLHYLISGTKRFNELHRLLGGISHRTLAKQLRELERDGIVVREQLTAQASPSQPGQRHRVRHRRIWHDGIHRSERLDLMRLRRGVRAIAGEERNREKRAGVS